MKLKDVVVLKEVVDDLNDGKAFYEQNESGLGDYFRDSLLADIESLVIYAGIHVREHGLYRMLSKRFPYAGMCGVESARNAVDFTRRCIDQPPSSPAFSKQQFKFLLSNPGLFEYLRKRGSFDRTVRRNGQLEHFHRVCLCRRIWLPLWRTITHPSR